MSLSNISYEPERGIVWVWTEATGLDALLKMHEQLSESQTYAGMTIRSSQKNHVAALISANAVEHPADVYGGAGLAQMVYVTLIGETPKGIKLSSYTDVPVGADQNSAADPWYTLPDRLKKPANSVDAAISRVLSDLVLGYSEAEAQANLLTFRSNQHIAAIDPTRSGAFVDMLLGSDTSAREAMSNALNHKARLEKLEHVLRMFVVKELDEVSVGRGPREGFVSLGTDYECASGILNQAFEAVQGTSGFGTLKKTKLLARAGLIAKQTFDVYHDKVTATGTAVNNQEIIWP